MRGVLKKVLATFSINIFSSLGYPKTGFSQDSSPQNNFFKTALPSIVLPLTILPLIAFFLIALPLTILCLTALPLTRFFQSDLSRILKFISSLTNTNACLLFKDIECKYKCLSHNRVDHLKFHDCFVLFFIFHLLSFMIDASKDKAFS